MPRSAKPKRKYHPRPVVKPLNMRDHWVLEGDVHAALLAIDHGQQMEEHLNALAAHADLIRRLESAPFHAQRQAQTIIRILAEVMTRGSLQITELEQDAIRAAIKVTLPALRTANNHAIERAAQAAWFAFNRDGGVVVDIGGAR